ncbi:hypothetical protein EPD60_05325 [Flaviaesturariibacter flavus]|uniref:AttH domain-containing protein n=1 Tax=Flaviaesturariibacter flavus TaxID=2502780 RepID=A0A4R1BK28_9BACT|nr:lipocalin-like domain-containing protein [Flaviaesturariibacter flavus]TCJ17617.1 hypothetical protein EPD60_05325 [Flaviaesturariibacter flavus]
MIAEQTLAPTTETGFINLPDDHYRHPGAPTEWWWHIGTLVTAEGRRFGFEVNGCGIDVSVMSGTMAALSITDVQQQQHYQLVNFTQPLPANWAEADTSKPWTVSIPGKGGGDNGRIAMQSVDGDVRHMAVQASFVDAKTGKACSVSLDLQQQGKEMLVWGTGRSPMINPEGKTPVEQYNYYYSFTNLAARGNITIDGEVYAVKGTTWMDHEYGVFARQGGGSVTWMLQDMQFAGGFCLSNYALTEAGVVPQEGVPQPGMATLLLTDGSSAAVATMTTPRNPYPVDGITYFLHFDVEVTSPGYDHLSFEIDSLCADQVFHDPTGINNGYEGNGTARMYVSVDLSQKITKRLLVSEGTSWIEEMFGKK